MSVTFHPELQTTGQFSFHCDETNTTVVRCSQDEIAAARVVHMSVCEECNHYGCFTGAVWDTDAEVNIANGNARAVLSALGLLELCEDELFGETTAQDMLDRIVLAHAADDRGSDTLVEAGDGLATMVHCGRPAGYLAERLAALTIVAEQAKSLGRMVVWG